MSRESSRGNTPVTVVTSVPWERERDITEVAMLAAPPTKRRTVSDSDIIVVGTAFILPLSLSVFACICILRDNWPVIDWREPIGLQKGWKGRSSHSGEFSVMSRSRSQGTEVTILTGAFCLRAVYSPLVGDSPLWEPLCTCCAQTPQIKCVTQKACVHRVHNSPECRLYQWSIRIKCRYAVLNVRRERDIVRPPAPVQITPELPTATAFSSGI